jgi:hypothetical protein
LWQTASLLAFEPAALKSKEHMMDNSIFTGCMPALMTPCKPDRTPDFDALVRKGKELIATGMSAVVYCGSMGDWPLLTDDAADGGRRAADRGGRARGRRHRRSQYTLGGGPRRPRRASGRAWLDGDPARAVARVFRRGAAGDHFKAILSAAPDLPAVIYNSPYYGFATRADLFFALRAEHPNLVGFKEFGGADDLRYAAEFITSRDDAVTLMIGVDTCVFHGVVNCGATGAITGIGNALPREVLHLTALCAGRPPPATPAPAVRRRSWMRRWPCCRASTRDPISCSITSILWC